MVDVTVVGGWGLIGLAGEYDVANSDEIPMVARHMISQGVTDVTVDLSRVAFIGVAGLDALVVVQDLVAAAGGRLVMVGATRFAGRLFALTGLDVVLPVVPGTFGPSDAAAVVPREADGGGVVDRFGDDRVGRGSGAAGLVFTDTTVAGDLVRVARAAVGAVEAACAASVTVIARGEARSAAVSNAVAVEVDVAQYTVRAGPCLDAARFGRRTRVDMVGVDRRYVHLAPFVLAAGVGAVLSVPVRHGGAVLGSLNVYCDRALPAGVEPVAEFFAAQAAVALIAPRLDAGSVGAATPPTATDADTDLRQVVRVAEQILMGVHNISAAQGHRLLRAAAIANHEPVVETARRLSAAYPHHTGTPSTPPSGTGHPARAGHPAGTGPPAGWPSRSGEDDFGRDQPAG